MCALPISCDQRRHQPGVAEHAGCRTFNARSRCDDHPGNDRASVSRACTGSDTSITAGSRRDTASGDLTFCSCGADDASNERRDGTRPAGGNVHRAFPHGHGPR